MDEKHISFLEKAGARGTKYVAELHGEITDSNGVRIRAYRSANNFVRAVELPIYVKSTLSSILMPNDDDLAQWRDMAKEEITKELLAKTALI